MPDLTERMSVEEYRRQVGQPEPDNMTSQTANMTSKPKAPGNAGWHNKPTWYESPMVGMTKFKSKAEVIRARQLDLMAAGEQITAWWYEVPLYCGFENDNGSPVRLYPDFKILWPDGSVTWEDVKGRAAAEDWDIKRKACEKLYGIEIRIIK
ncbi:MAG: hypothetical protein ACR2RE_28145 [Geminicoccaceae bacterium]